MGNLYYIFECIEPLNFVYSGKMVAQKDFIHPKRIMKDYMIIIVSSGKIYIEQNEKKYEAKAKEILFNLPYIYHAGYQESPTALTYYWLHFTSNKPPIILTEVELKEKIKNNPNYFKKKIIIPDHFSLIDYDSVILLAGQLQQAIMSQQSEDFKNYLITVLCLDITNQIINKFHPKVDNIPIKLRKIIESITLKTFSIMKISEIAEEFNYSEKYLIYLFKKHLGVTPHQFIINEKITKSKALLVDTNLSIKDIAYTLGFDDNHHFMTIFKRIVGITPNNYRKTFITKD